MSELKLLSKGSDSKDGSNRKSTGLKDGDNKTADNDDNSKKDADDEDVLIADENDKSASTSSKNLDEKSDIGRSDEIVDIKTGDGRSEDGKSGQQTLENGNADNACGKGFVVISSFNDSHDIDSDIHDEHQPLDSNSKDEMEDLDPDVPIDKGWAWMIVFGAFWMHVVVIGGCKSFGVLYVVFGDKYQASAGALSTVMSLPIALVFALGVVANMLSAKLTCWLVVFVGGILGCVGFFLTAFMPNFVGVVFTFGILGGFAFSLCYSPCVVMVGQHFRKYRSLAMGISVAGSGVGTFAIPNLMRLLVREYALSGCLIIFSGIVLNLSVFALIFRPWSSYRRRGITLNIKAAAASASRCNNNDFSGNGDLKTGGTSSSSSSRRVGDDGRVGNNINGNLYVVEERGHGDDGCGEVGGLTVKYEYREGGNGNDKEIESFEVNEELLNGGREGGKSETTDGGRPVQLKEKQKKRLLDWTLLFHPVFLMYAFSNALATPGYGYVFVMLPDYAEDNGHTRDTAALITSIIGVSDLAGRLFFGWFSDLNIFPKRWGFIGCMACSAVLNLILPSLTSFLGMVVYAVIFGFFSGSFITLTPVLYAEDLGTERLGSSFGLNGLFMSVAFLAGPPVCGSIKDATGSWDAAFYCVGVLTLIAALLPVFQPWGQRWVERRDDKKRMRKSLVE